MTATLHRDNLEQYAATCEQNIASLNAEIERLRAALDEYACYGLANCPVEKLKDGSCIHACTGHCGNGAFVALQPINHEQYPSHSEKSSEK